MKAVLSTCAGRAGLGLRASRSGPCVPSGAGLCPQGQRGPCVPAQSAVLLGGSVPLGWPGCAQDHEGLGGGSHPRHGCDRAPIPGPSSEGPGPGYPRDALRGAGSLLPAGRAVPGRAGPLWPRWQGRDVSATWPRGGAGGSDTRTGLGERVPGDTGGTGSGACWVSGYRGSAGCGALRVPRAPSHPCERIPAVLEPGQLPEPPPLSQRRVPSGPPADPRAGPAPVFPVFPSRRSPRWRVRNLPVMLILLLLLGPAAWAAPREGTNRPEPPVATIVDLYPDPLSLESPALLLLRSAVRSLGPPQQDVEAMTREQALLYLFVLHDHDQSRRLDGLELLQLLGTVLAQAGGQPDPDMVAALVDQALATQDLNGDGLLDPSELLDPPEVLLPGQDQGPPGQPPLEQQAGAGAGAAAAAGAGGGAALPRQDLELRSPGQAATEAGDPKVESLRVESPSAEALEAEVIPEAKAPSTDATEEEEAPEAEAPEEQAAPAWRDHGEG
ncbi:cell growth regulator with EF hand domain protein 1 [Parus major]|uniref:cell growth regulator with EF hand domain protein 1 n=1 Tax=Parus major TaxID=9157 RepID=UPI0007711A72|nr:cell growth regulator with EF hand domain protein 1 [Parus major]